ncbi:hypothetical protein A2U01_0048056, partial [Trifolium medium]|nr:hypothetical protein [Trifolium medium]
IYASATSNYVAQVISRSSADPLLWIL